jgi:hypothetical protein
VRLTSGRRYTWIRNHVLHVNPDFRDGGWHELVHLLSHYCAHKLFPNAKGHGPQHAEVERDMITHVVQSGWLDGKLKRPETPKPDRKVKKLDSVERRLKLWETKRKRAETAIRKLRAQQKRLTYKSTSGHPSGHAIGRPRLIAAPWSVSSL